MSWTGPRMSIEYIYSVSRHGWDELDWAKDEYSICILYLGMDRMSWTGPRMSIEYIYILYLGMDGMSWTGQRMSIRDLLEKVDLFNVAVEDSTKEQNTGEV